MYIKQQTGTAATYVPFCPAVSAVHGLMYCLFLGMRVVLGPQGAAWMTQLISTAADDLVWASCFVRHAEVCCHHSVVCMVGRPACACTRGIPSACLWSFTELPSLQGASGTVQHLFLL